MTNSTLSAQQDLSASYAALLAEISPQAPCGVNIDEDPQFLLLQSGLQPKTDAQYGDFYEPAEAVNWVETEAVTRSLLQKSKDIRLVIILMRCRIRQAGPEALSEGLRLLLVLLQTWPDDLYPQLIDEGEFTPLLRANAFAELNDINGLLADFRQLPLPKKAGVQISIRDWEKAHAVPRPQDAISADMTGMLMQQWQETEAPLLNTLALAAEYADQLNQLMQINMGPDAPAPGKIRELLALFSVQKATAPPVIPEPPRTTAEQQDNPPVMASPAAIITPSSPASGPGRIQCRESALVQLREVRHWFSEAEPGSPAILMLHYIEQSIGRDFAELVSMYPPEIISLLKNH